MNKNSFYKNKKVLITGGAGFIGSHLVEILVEQGARICVPVRQTTNLQFLKNIKGDVSIVKADLTHRADVDAIMKEQEIVLNLAAAKGGGIAYSSQHHASLFRDNLQPFLNIIDSARVAQVERFLVVSSACVYPSDAISPTPEEEGFHGNPDPSNAGYGLSKRMEEYLGKEYAKEFGMKIAIARPFNAYGPRDDFFAPTNHVIPGLIKRILNNENPLTVWGTGKQTRSFLYATDFARGLMEVCEKYAVADPLNLGSSEEISIADLAKLLVEIIGIKIKIKFDPSKPDGQPRRACDTKKAAEKIGFQATVLLRDGLQKTIEWYLKEKQFRNLT